MKKFILILLVCFSSTAFANDAFWEESRIGYTIYFDGSYAETPFNDLGVPINGTSITNVTWDWNKLPVTTNVVELCYQKPYSRDNFRCIEMTGVPQGSADNFNGLDARGTFMLRMTTYGGSYPIYSSSRTADTIRVDYDIE